MEAKKEFGQGILFTFTNYVYWLLVTNIYFVLANVIFIFFFMTLEPTFSNIILYFFALIPTGPAISALFYSMEKLVRTKELSPTADFFYGYKSNMKGTLSTWLFILVVFFVLVVDLQFLQNSISETSQVLSIILFIFTVIWAMLSLNILAINAKFKFRMRDILKLSIYYSFIKFKNSIGNLLILFIVGFLTTITIDFFIIFTSSIVAFFMMLNTKEVIKDIELNFLKTSPKHSGGERR